MSNTTTKQPKPTDAELDALARQFYAADNGEPYLDPFDLPFVRESMRALRRRVDMLIAALEDPTAPGAADVLAGAERLILGDTAQDGATGYMWILGSAVAAQQTGGVK